MILHHQIVKYVNYHFVSLEIWMWDQN